MEIITRQHKITNMETPKIDFGDLKLNVFPVVHGGMDIRLPVAFKPFERCVRGIFNYIPVQPQAMEHYVTIDTKFFTESGYLRREGVHIDGNFCADPTFQHPTWAGITFEKGEIIQNWASPYGIIPPIGTYVSEDLGGILCLSSAIGCEFWRGTFYGEILGGGDADLLRPQLTEDKRRLMDANGLYFMTSNTPHCTLPVFPGTRRTLIRVTLNHLYENKNILVGKKKELVVA